MPTPHRTIRVPDDEWHALQAAAKDEEGGASGVIRRLVKNWLAARED